MLAHTASGLDSWRRILIEPPDLPFGERQFTIEDLGGPPVDLLRDVDRYGSGGMGSKSHDTLGVPLAGAGCHPAAQSGEWNPRIPQSPTELSQFSP